MLLAFDAHYRDDCSILAGAVFHKWEDEQAAEMRTWQFGEMPAYEPGKFYLRELPLLTQALSTFDSRAIDAIIIDGYVYLDAKGRLGLGGHLFASLQEKIPVVGVAKSYFRENAAEQVLRGESKKPLYVTAAGMLPATAARKVAKMAGSFRMPDMLVQVDQASKEKRC